MVRKTLSTHTWILMVALSLGAGAVASVLGSGPDDLEGLSEANVPVGSVGDQVTYVKFLEAEPGPFVHGAPYQPGDETWLIQEIAILRIDGIEPGLSSNGQAFEALTIVRNLTKSAFDPTPIEGDGSAAGEARMVHLEVDGWRAEVLLAGQGFVEEESIDLVNRASVTTFTSEPSTSHMSASFRDPVLFFHERPSWIPGLPLQGKQFRLGETLPPTLLTWKDYCMESQTSSWWDSLEGNPESVETSRVTHTGTIDGVPAIGLQKTLNFQRAGQAAGRLVELGENITLTLDVWIGRDHAYPLFIECSATSVPLDADGNPIDVTAPRGRHLLRVLTEFKPGAGPFVPWSSDPVSPPEPPRELDRSPPGIPFPADGTPSPLAYPLETAAQDASVVSGIPAYRVWQDSHPQAALVGASYLADGGSPEIRSWRLYYAENETAFAIQVERTEGSQEVATNASGPWQTYGTYPEPGPPTSTDLVTLQELAGRWQAVAPDGLGALPVRSLSWGRQPPTDWMWVNPDSCRLERPSLEEQGFSMPSSWFQETAAAVRIGTAQPLDCDTGGTTLSEAYLTLSARDGQMVLLEEHHPGSDAPESRRREFRVLSPEEALPAGFHAPDVRLGAAAATTLFVLAAVAYLAPALKYTATRGLFLVGFSRLTKDRLLDNQVRDRLLEAISQDPGINATDLKRRTDIGWGTVVYHLMVLERNKLVSSVSDGRHRRFFPVGLVDWSKRGQLALLKNERARQVYEIVRADPGTIQESLVDRLGLSRATTIWHLGRLEESGLVGRVRRGRKVHYYPNTVASELHDPDGAMEIA